MAERRKSVEALAHERRAEAARKRRGERLRELREQRSLTQEQLAERSGLRFETISKIELGKQWARGGTEHKLARGLGVEAAELLKPPGAELSGEPDAGFVALLGQAGAKDLREQMVLAMELGLYPHCLAAIKGIVGAGLERRIHSRS